MECVIINHLHEDLTLKSLSRDREMFKIVGKSKKNAILNSQETYYTVSYNSEITYECISTQSFSIPTNRNYEKFYIHLGATVYDSYGDTNITTLGISNQIPSFYIHNRLKYDVQITIHNKKGNCISLGILKADDNKNYKGSSQSVLFFNTNSNDISYGDELCITKEDGTIINKVILKDRYMKNLIIGAVVIRCDKDVKNVPINDRLHINYSGKNNLSYYTPEKTIAGYAVYNL